MSTYAVIRLKGQQFKVSEGEEILVSKSDITKIDPEVLLLVKDGKVSLGQPLVSGGKISLKVLSEEEKGEKIRVVKYKSKSRYRKTSGFRPKYTRLLVEKVA